jgi:hypothetical protein
MRHVAAPSAKAAFRRRYVDLALTEDVLRLHRRVELTFQARGATRNLLASTFGLAADLPTSVTTGCGIMVAYAIPPQNPPA